MKVFLTTSNDHGGTTRELSNKEIVILLLTLNELQDRMWGEQPIDLDGDNALTGRDSLASFEEVNHLTTTFEELNNQFKYL